MWTCLSGIPPGLASYLHRLAIRLGQAWAGLRWAGQGRAGHSRGHSSARRGRVGQGRRAGQGSTFHTAPSNNNHTSSSALNSTSNPHDTPAYPSLALFEDGFSSGESVTDGKHFLSRSSKGRQPEGYAATRTTQIETKRDAKESLSHCNPKVYSRVFITYHYIHHINVK